MTLEGVRADLVQRGYILYTPDNRDEVVRYVTVPQDLNAPVVIHFADGTSPSYARDTVLTRLVP